MKYRGLIADFRTQKDMDLMDEGAMFGWGFRCRHGLTVLIGGTWSAHVAEFKRRTVVIMAGSGMFW